MANIMVQDWNNTHGQIEVHKPGCRDIAKKRDTTTYGVADLKELVLVTYPADDFGFDEATEWEGYLTEFKFMPCCPDIPMPGQDATDAPEIAADAPAVVVGARGTHHTHAACGHELTPLARAACRATHTWNGTAWAPNA